MLKRLISLLLAMALLCPCALAEGTLADRYEAAATLMVSGDYEGAADAFAALTGYGDAPQMAIYCRGLAFAAAGDYDTAVLAFTALGDFKDSAIRAAYLTGVGAQTRAEDACARGKLMDLETALLHLDTAEIAYASLIYLPDVPDRLARCRLLRQEISAALPGLRLAHQCDRVATGDDEHFIVWQDGKAGLLHISGKLVIPCEWDSILSVGQGRAAVYRGSLDAYGNPKNVGCGVIDFSGREILPSEWWSIMITDIGLWAYDENWQCTVYTLDGEPLPESISHLVTEDRALVLGDRTWTLADAEGYPLYTALNSQLYNCLAADSSIWIEAEVNGERRVGLLSLDGELLLPFEYTIGCNDSLDAACMVLIGPDGTHSAFDAAGQRLFDNRWDSLAYAGEGMFAVMRDGLLGYADAQGYEVIPCAYDVSYRSDEGIFIGGLVTVNDPESYYQGCLDRTGRVILPLEWDYVFLTDSFIIAEKESGDAAVILNHEGTVLLTVPEDSSNASFGVAKDYLAVTFNDRLTIIDAKGNVIY